MVNHFASLLINIDPLLQKPAEEGFVLSTDDGFFIIITDAGEEILLSGYGGTPKVNPYSLFIDRRYTPIFLPEPLEAFRSLLFHNNASSHYNQFLLYYYLRLVNGSDRAKDIFKHDGRLTYDLDEIDEYFKFTRISAPKTNDTSFRVLLGGKLQQTEDVNSFSSVFTINQIQNTDSITIFSPTQKKYYKLGMPPTNNPTGMSIPLEFEPGGLNITKQIPIGDTGLFFRLTGANGTSQGFTASSNKFWSFTAEAPANIDFLTKFHQIENSARVITTMLSYKKEECDVNYENIWFSHYNSMYRLAGLLLAYVERVNIVWQNTAM